MDDECFMAVHEGECSDLDERYHEEGNEIWRKRNTGFTTNRSGKAAGMLFELESGYKYGKNKCKAMVIYWYGPDSDEKTGTIGCGILVPDGKAKDFCQKRK